MDAQIQNTVTINKERSVAELKAIIEVPQRTLYPKYLNRKYSRWVWPCCPRPFEPTVSCSNPSAALRCAAHVLVQCRRS